MLGTVLWILKIIGIILAVLLGILLVTAVCALFVPLRYQGSFSVTGEEGTGKKSAAANLRITWLLRFIRVFLTCEETARIRVKVFVFTLLDTGKEEKPEKKRRGRKKQKGAFGKPEKEQGENREKTQDKDTGEESAKTESPVTEKCKEAKSAGAGKEGTSPDKAAQEAPEKEPEGRIKKSGIKQRISNLLYTIREFCDKLRKIKDKKDKVTALWASDHMVSSRGLLGRELLYLLKHSKPRRMEGLLKFGFSDPSATGYAMALYGILYPVWNPKLIVEPDFEKEILNCRIRLKGKIRLVHFLKTGLRLLLSGDVRKAIRDFREL